MKIIKSLLFISIIICAIPCFGIDAIEFKIAYHTNRADTYIYKDKYNRILFIDNRPSIALSDLMKVNVIVEEEEPPPWLKSLERDPNIAIRNKRISFQVKFNEQGKIKFTKLTSENIGNFLVVIINDEIVMTPTIQERIDSGEAFITTSFTETEAREFANRVNNIIKIE